MQVVVLELATILIKAHSPTFPGVLMAGVAGMDTPVLESEAVIRDCIHWSNQACCSGENVGSSASGC